MNEILIYIIIGILTLSAFPIGILVKKLTQDEQKSGRKWFILTILFSLIGILLSFIFVPREFILFVILCFVFIILITLPSVIKKI